MTVGWISMGTFVRQFKSLRCFSYKYNRDYFGICIFIFSISIRKKMYNEVHQSYLKKQKQKDLNKLTVLSSDQLHFHDGYDQ